MSVARVRRDGRRRGHEARGDVVNSLRDNNGRPMQTVTVASEGAGAATTNACHVTTKHREEGPVSERRSKAMYREKETTRRMRNGARTTRLCEDGEGGSQVKGMQALAVAVAKRHDTSNLWPETKKIDRASKTCRSI